MERPAEPGPPGFPVRGGRADDPEQFERRGRMHRRPAGLLSVQRPALRALCPQGRGPDPGGPDRRSRPRLYARTRLQAGAPGGVGILERSVCLWHGPGPAADHLHLSHPGPGGPSRGHLRHGHRPDLAQRHPECPSVLSLQLRFHAHPERAAGRRPPGAAGFAPDRGVCGEPGDGPDRGPDRPGTAPGQLHRIPGSRHRGKGLPRLQGPAAGPGLDHRGGVLPGRGAGPGAPDDVADSADGPRGLRVPPRDHPPFRPEREAALGGGHERGPHRERTPDRPAHPGGNAAEGCPGPERPDRPGICSSASETCAGRAFRPPW